MLAQPVNLFVHIAKRRRLQTSQRVRHTMQFAQRWRRDHLWRGRDASHHLRLGRAQRLE